MFTAYIGLLKFVIVIGHQEVGKGVEVCQLLFLHSGLKTDVFTENDNLFHLLKDGTHLLAALGCFVTALLVGEVVRYGKRRFLGTRSSER